MSAGAGHAIRDDLPALRKVWFEFETWLNAIGEPEEIDPRKFDAFEALAFGTEPLCQVLTGRQPAPLTAARYRSGFRK